MAYPISAGASLRLVRRRAAVGVQLHKIFARSQVNEVNPRKEFFRVPLGAIRGYLEQQGINAIWTVAVAASVQS